MVQWRDFLQNMRVLFLLAQIHDLLSKILLQDLSERFFIARVKFQHEFFTRKNRFSAFLAVFRRRW